MGSGDFIHPSSSACQIHRPSLFWLWVVSTAVSLVALALAPFFIRAVLRSCRAKSFKGAFVLVIGACCVSSAFMGLFRVTDLEHRTIGVDVSMSLLWALCVALLWGSALMCLIILFRALGKYVVGDGFRLYMTSPLAARIKHVNAIWLPVLYVSQLTLLLTSLILTLSAKSQPDMYVAAGIYSVAVVSFSCIYLVYFAMVIKCLLLAISASSGSLGHAAMKRRLRSLFVVLACITFFSCFPVGIVYFCAPVFMGHIIGYAYAAAGSWCLFCMWLEWPVPKPAPTAMDSGRSTSRVHLPPRFATKRLFWNKSVDKMKRVSEVEEEAGTTVDDDRPPRAGSS